MKRNSILGGLFFFLFLAAGCEKGEMKEASQKGQDVACTDEGATASENKLAPIGGGLSYCICSGYKVVDPVGNDDPSDYNCSGSGSNCNKLLPCPCPDKSGDDRKEIKKADIEALDRAIVAGKVRSFFKGDRWSKLFPYLKDDRKTLSLLRSGDLTLNAQRSRGEDKLSYLAVRKEMRDEKSIPISDIRFCMTRPVCEK